MKIAIMQPYLFPYIGYFQLINAVDQFVVYDDVQWIKGGWINRNRIIVHGQPHYFTLPVQKAPLRSNINQRGFHVDIETQKNKIIRQVEDSYRNAPYFEQVIALLTKCFVCKERNVSRFVVNTLSECCDYLNIITPFVMSSDLDVNDLLTGQARVIDINIAMNASHYINPIGGVDLYSKSLFSKHGLSLSFIKTRNVSYRQMRNDNFLPFLSIIDVMMFNSTSEIADLLKTYDLV